MKKILLVFITLLSVLVLVSCKDKNDQKNNSIMTIDVNPSVELVIGEDGKVVSVTALNDDGAIVIQGEVIVGLKADEAASKIISIIIETGYISESDAKQISLTITGEGENKLFEHAKAKINEVLDRNNIKSEIVHCAALTREQLEALVAEAGAEFSKEMSDNELIQKLSEIRQEYSSLITTELRDAYLQFKEYKIEFAEKEETKEIINSLGLAYKLLLSSYSVSLALLDTNIKAVEDAYYNYFIDSESNYQIALGKIRELKINLAEYKNIETPQELVDFLNDEAFDFIPNVSELRNTLSDLINDPSKQEELKTTFENTFNTCKSCIEAQLVIIEQSLLSAEAVAKAAIDLVVTTLNQAKSQLEILEEAFPKDVTNTLTEKAKQIESKMNEAKQNALNSFEEEHKADIEAIEEEITNAKNKLKEEK